jgi:hypothetical protein
VAEQGLDRAERAGPLALDLLGHLRQLVGQRLLDLPGHAEDGVLGALADLRGAALRRRLRGAERLGHHLGHPVVQRAQLLELGLGAALVLVAALLQGVDPVIGHQDLHREVERVAQELDVIEFQRRFGGVAVQVSQSYLPDGV